MSEQERTEAAGNDSIQDAPVEPAASEIPEGADPGSPTMDYFEKGEKPDGESR
jgi:hypothetical protein